MPETIEVYTLSELKDSFPDAYTLAIERERNRIQLYDDIPWAGEIVQSARAVIKACGGTLRTWDISPGRCREFQVEVDDSHEHYDIDEPITIEHNLSWFISEVLKPNGYAAADGTVSFPGNCKLTGYCADDIFLEYVHKELSAGHSLSQSLGWLGDEIAKLFESECEYAASEENISNLLSDRHFTSSGEEVTLSK